MHFYQKQVKFSLSPIALGFVNAKNVIKYKEIIWCTYRIWWGLRFSTILPRYVSGSRTSRKRAIIHVWSNVWGRMWWRSKLRLLCWPIGDAWLFRVCWCVLTSLQAATSIRIEAIRTFLDWMPCSGSNIDRHHLPPLHTRARVFAHYRKPTSRPPTRRWPS